MFWNLAPEVAEERCEHCLLAEKHFHQVVYSFIQDRKKRHEIEQRKVFFGLWHIDQDNEDMTDLFMNFHGYSTIPWLTVIQENTHRQPGEPFVSPSHEWNILATDTFTGMKQLDFVNNALSTDVEFKLTMKQLILSNLVITGGLTAFVCIVVFGYQYLLL